MSSDPQPVPFIDLKRSVKPHSAKILEEWSRILAETDFVGGKRVTAFEEQMKHDLNVQNVVACANGTDALILALQAAGVTHGSRVALPNMTFWATYEAVVQLGGVPVLIDTDLEDLQMDFEEFVTAYEKHRFQAAMLVHLFGWCSRRLSDFRKFCLERGITLVEDGAQSYGVKVDGRSIYEDAQIATHSFYPAKVFGGAMDGGAIVGKDKKLTDTCRTLANHGRAQHYSYSHVGWNSRMSGIQAAFLSEMMPEVPSAIASRNRALELYENIFQAVPNSPIRMWKPPVGVSGNGYLSVLHVKDRLGEDLKKRLADRKIGVGRVYPETIIEQACTPKDTLRVSELPRSIEFAKKVINLPLFAQITEEEVRIAAETFLEIVKE